MIAERPQISAWEAESVIGLPMGPGVHGLDWSRYALADRGSVWASRFVPGPIPPGPSTVDLSFGALSLERGRFGTTAKLAIYLQDRMLSWAQLNLDQPRERFGLALAAHAALPAAMRSRYRREQLQSDLDTFCFGLAEAWAELHPATDGGPGESRSERRALASQEQWQRIRSLRAELGIRDSADLPERMLSAQASALVRHLEDETRRQSERAGG